MAPGAEALLSNRPRSDFGNFRAHTAGVLGKLLPFPIRSVYPYYQRSQLLRAARLGRRAAQDLYADARSVYHALDARFKRGGTDFLLGRRPSSLDATVFAHLLLHRVSPLAPPELRREARRALPPPPSFPARR